MTCTLARQQKGRVFDRALCPPALARPPSFAFAGVVSVCATTPRQIRAHGLDRSRADDPIEQDVPPKKSRRGTNAFWSLFTASCSASRLGRLVLSLPRPCGSSRRRETDEANHKPHNVSHRRLLSVRDSTVCVHVCCINALFSTDLIVRQSNPTKSTNRRPTHSKQRCCRPCCCSPPSVGRRRCCGRYLQSGSGHWSLAPAAPPALAGGGERASTMWWWDVRRRGGPPLLQQPLIFCSRSPPGVRWQRRRRRAQIPSRPRSWARSSRRGCVRGVYI